MEYCLGIKNIDSEALNPTPPQISLKVDSVDVKQNLMNIASQAEH